MSLRLRCAVGAACVLALAGCTGDSANEPDKAPVVQLGAPGESNRSLDQDEIDGLDEAPAHTDADVAFVQNMIPHHQQALVMTALVAERAAGRGVPLLAERMEISQQDEIRQLEEWLTNHGEDVPTGNHHHVTGHAELMPGMLSEADLSRLEVARGNAFDRLFLQFMIRHHQGALLMVGELFSGDGGQEPAVFQLAQHIDADQRVEIARMRSLLARM